MSVRGYSLPQIKKLAQNDIGSFVSYPGESLQFLRGFGHKPLEIGAYFFCRSDYVFCFIAEKRDGRYFSLKCLRLGMSEVECSLVFAKKSFSNTIYDLVRTLCG